ncbi:hypothetical protein [Streptomyces sp. cg2]|uniref:hypothetical protein n=1 Tax=Streptomyces sp. cg2 TaxID=3238799 RepID=UPI0034E2E6AC
MTGPVDPRLAYAVSPEPPSRRCTITWSATSSTTSGQWPQFQRDFDKTMANDVTTRPDGPFTTERQSTAPGPKDGEKSLDWYHGLNHFQYRVVGETRDDQVTYHIDIQKRYDWGIRSGHRQTLAAFGGPFKMELEQADLAHLNTTGLARDFDVKGTSGQMRTPL